MAVVAAGAMARIGFVSEHQKLLPWDLSVFVLVSFTLLIYQLDSLIALLKSNYAS